jgi:hypothetical protein
MFAPAGAEEEDIHEMPPGPQVGILAGGVAWHRLIARDARDVFPIE